MLNYANLNDVEFEYLCQDIMQEKLKVKLRRFAQGKDGGIDLTDDVNSKNIVVQVKHYTDTAKLISALKKEVEKVQNLNPKQYYICCSKELTPQKTNEIYELFKDYMKSSNNIITLNEIDDFLVDAKNIEILKKHYKLWIESTGILENIINNDNFVDCEVLLSDIRREEKMFVQTSAYYTALKCLGSNKSLFITGNPGVGKTMTSKMLTLYYAANGYRVRYTTNGSDLGVLKKSLSKNADIKEIILVDDCLGQAYFQMKESQNNELLSLIKYVNMSSNKLLILNSRVTIFQEAKERSPELIKSFENKEYQVFVIDMTAISNLEKAKILYNHLYFNDIPPEYFSEIKKEKRYRKIIAHVNYNPRLIEFICSRSRYQSIRPEDYYPFIIRQLNNPQEIWRDEYERRLQKTDRILLTTIYSLSDKATEQDLVKKCFEKRIKTETDIDVTINQFEASLMRLTDGFIRIIDDRGTKKLSMVNPSINDYLDGRLSNNMAERQAIINSSYSIYQLKRLLNDTEFSDYAKELIINRRADNYLYNNERQKLSFVVYYTAKHKICDNFYMNEIHNFLRNPHPLIFYAFTEVSIAEIIEALSDEKLCEFYKIKECLSEQDVLKNLISHQDLQKAVDTISCIDILFDGKERDDYIKAAISGLKESIKSYFDFVSADDFNINVASIIDISIRGNEYGDYIDYSRAEDFITEDIQNNIEEDIEKILLELPKDIIVPEDFIENLPICIEGIDELIDEYLYEDSDMEDEYADEQNPTENSEIDFIFNRN